MRPQTLGTLALALALALPLAACSDDGTGGLTDTVVNVEVNDASDSSDVSSPTDTSVTTTTTTTTTATDASSPNEIDVGPPNIGWTILQFPGEHTGQPSSTFAVYARVFAAGVTEAAGQGAGIVAEGGVGGSDIASWTWTAATFNVDVDGANDEYIVTLTAPATDGDYRFGFRFKLGDGNYVYADLDGLDNGFDIVNTGVLHVVTPDPAAIDWCNLQFPDTLTANPGAPVGTIFGQVYEPGMTDTVAGSDPGYTLVGELGWGVGDDAAAYTWVAATYGKDVGNNDEFEATFQAPAIGTYHFAYRFRFVATPNDWIYCDLTGLADGFDVADTGTLTVAAAPPNQIDYAILRPATVTWAASEPAPRFEVVVYEPGATDGAGQGGLISVRVDYQRSDGVENGGFAVQYRGDENGLGVNDNDVYGGTLPADLPAGTYRVSATVTFDDGEPVQVDATGTADGYSDNDVAVATITPAVAPIPDFCRLNGAELTNAKPGAVVGGFVVQAYEAGVTPNSTTIKAELGVGPVGGAPEGNGFTWVSAPKSGTSGNDDLFAANVTAPATEGTFNVAGRVAIGDGPWLYCDDDGSADGYDATQTTRLQAAYERFDYCRIQFPTEDVSTVPLTSIEVYGVGYEPGVTGEGNTHPAGLKTEVGFGAIGSTPDDRWTWSAGTFNVFADNGFGQKTNDEYRAQLTPTVPGVYAWAWRMSLDGGTSWLYCDEAGSQPFDATKAGVLDVGE